MQYISHIENNILKVKIINPLSFQFAFCILPSTGFGIPSIDDDTVMDEEGKKRRINCGTEKCKHKSKNHRTAGNLVKTSIETT